MRKMKAKLLLIITAIIMAGISLLNLASALTITSVTSNPQEIQPGEKVSLDLEIENNLNDDVTDVTISLDLKDVPFAPYQSSSDISYDEIREDRSKNVEFELIANSDAESGTYKIPVKISYILNNEEKESSGLVSLLVHAEPKLEISLEDSVLIKGKNNDLRVKIVNSGLGNAKFLNVKIKEVSGLKLLSASSVYLGNLDSDDFDSAEFKVFISEQAGIINLPVTLTYTDARNNKIGEDLSLQLKTYTEKQAVELGLIKKSNTAIIVSGIIIIVILFFVYRGIRRKLKKKKLEQE